MGRLSQEELTSQLPSFLPALFDAFGNQSADVRKVNDYPVHTLSPPNPTPTQERSTTNLKYHGNYKLFSCESYVITDIYISYLTYGVIDFYAPCLKAPALFFFP